MDRLSAWLASHGLAFLAYPSTLSGGETGVGGFSASTISDNFVVRHRYTKWPNAYFKKLNLFSLLEAWEQYRQSLRGTH